jgi:hypothetical protein
MIYWRKTAVNRSCPESPVAASSTRTDSVQEQSRGPPSWPRHGRKSSTAASWCRAVADVFWAGRPRQQAKEQREARSRRRPLAGARPRTRRRKLPAQKRAGYTEVTWAEDRATRGRDPSADSGAKTGAGGRKPPLGVPGIGRQAINPLTCCVISRWCSNNSDSTVLTAPAQPQIVGLSRLGECSATM